LRISIRTVPSASIWFRKMLLVTYWQDF